MFCFILPLFHGVSVCVCVCRARVLVVGDGGWG